jgi:hypothetical protein
MTCSECGATPASYVSFNVGEETNKVCLCEKCIAEYALLGLAPKPDTKPN